MYGRVYDGIIAWGEQGRGWVGGEGRKAVVPAKIDAGARHDGAQGKCYG
jgi:hypothetical protein